MAGDHTLILAPTGSGKTLAAFMWGIDRLVTSPPVDDRSRRTRVLYISPLRALAVDVEKNLRSPLVGVRLAAERLAAERGETAVVHQPTVAIRSGDTPADERRRQQRNPPDLLITTPESLYLLLTSAARDTLLGVEAVIIDEIHAMAGTKRGAHLALTLERLEARADRPPQRIGLSATQRPLDEIARFLGGHEASGRPRPVTVVDAGSRKQLDVEVIVPVDDMGDLSVGAPVPTAADPTASGAPRHSIWPALHPRLLDLVQQHRSTLVFVNARRSAERLATRLNELASTGQSRGAESDGTPPALATDLVRAHHGSISREQRLVIEDDLKAGRVRGLVATSSLELGIDMGAVDLVVQVGSPGAVSRGLQRVGRAGHQVGEPSRGKVFPSHRSDLLEVAAIVPRMKAGLVEETRVPRNPLDVLAQQIVAMVALDEWKVDDLAALVRRAAPFHEVSDEVLTAVLDLLGGRYPSEQFAELRPRLVWDRLAGTLRGRAGAQRLAVTNGGTIPDRGLYGVFLPDGTRVGELDEEMVYESRPGETFLLGASTWRIDEITHDRVVVVPAPGLPGKMPFWHGDGPGRPVELGRAMGELVRTLRSQPSDEATAHLRDEAGFDELATSNLLLYLSDQAAATGAVPDDRTIVVERFRDEIGDWRVCVLSPFGSQVHAPWAMALRHRLAERWGVEVDVLWSDDGLAIRLPEAIDELPLEELTIDADELRDIVVAALPSTPMFAARFREASARALLIPRRRPGQRTPLWQQRQRSADLLSVASAHPTFPMLLEATRECLHDVFDLPSLQELLRDLRSRKVRLVAVDTPRASPWAQSLVFDWVAAHLYDGDAPLAERRVAALTLDRELLAELLGAEELRELLDPAVLADLEAELQRLIGPFHPARDADAVHDLLRVLGPLTGDEVVARAGPDAGTWLDELRAGHRIIDVAVAGEARVAAADDAARLRDGLGVAIPLGLPTAYTDPVPTPLADLVARYARTHGPFLAAEIATRLGVDPHRVEGELADLEVSGRVVRGEFRPGGVTPRVVRRRRAPTAAAALPGQPAPRGGAGRGRCLRPVPHRVAGPRRAAPRGRRPGRGGHLAAGRRHPGHRPRDRRAPRPGRRLPVSRPRRAVRGRRGGVGRRGRARQQQRSGAPLLPRPGAGPGRRPHADRRRWAARRRSRPSVRAAARRAPRPAVGPGRLVLARPRGGLRRGRAGLRRPHGPGGAVGPGVVGRGHQRHPGAPPQPPHRPAVVACRSPWCRTSPPRAPHPHRPAGRGRSLVAGVHPARHRSRGAGPHAHRGRARAGLAAARTPRRGHPRGGPGRGRARRLRGRVPRAARPRGARPGAARLLRVGPRRRAVRAAGCRRPAAGLARRA